PRRPRGRARLIRTASAAQEPDRSGPSFAAGPASPAAARPGLLGKIKRKRHLPAIRKLEITRFHPKPPLAAAATLDHVARAGREIIRESVCWSTHYNLLAIARPRSLQIDR